jgi:hypothetical protein
MAFKKKALEIAGFDPVFALLVMMDLCWRLQNAGYQIDLARQRLSGTFAATPSMRTSTNSEATAKRRRNCTSSILTALTFLGSHVGLVAFTVISLRSFFPVVR